jgi:crotonobetainyl-CoA:carnitine CoA-transferase CaiB-like acyl-CoA transferase
MIYAKLSLLFIAAGVLRCPGMKPLQDIRILDLSRVFAAPFATQMLSDLGAEVWKIESPKGDDTRKWGAHVFAAFNRGKKSIAVDLKTADGQAVVRRLAAKADVVVENFKTGDLARYGLDYPALSKLNDRLVYLSLTGFGQTGPRKDQPGYDTVIQAMSGIMSVTGDPDRPPGRVGIAWIDVMSGLTTTIGILAALNERQRSGKGQHIDLSLFDVGMMALVDAGQDFLQNGRVHHRVGSITRNLSPAQPFQAADGWVVVAVGNDEQFARMCPVLGLPELATDPRFTTNALRIEHRAVLAGLLAAKIATYPRATLIEMFEAARVPLSPIHGIDESLQDPQTLARDIIWNLGNGVRSLANPLQRMSRTPAAPAGPPPALGQHTLEVLAAELGLNAEALTRLQDEGAIIAR